METRFCPTCGHALADPSPPFCTNCGASLPPAGVGGADSGNASGVERTPPPVVYGSIPFEDRSRPFLARFMATVKLAFGDPFALFAEVPAGDIGPPVLYGVLIGTVAAFFGSLWQFLIVSVVSVMDEAAADQLALSGGLIVLLMVLSPVLAAVGLLISAGTFHLMLLLVGDGRRGFAVTLRACAYGSTPSLLAVVPLCGGLAGGIWAIVLTIIGATRGQRTHAWRAALAYFLPLLACCCLGLLTAMAFGFLTSLAR